MSLMYDVVILGGGIVGLSIAKQLKEVNINISIAVVDKEDLLGLHNSGRNSGVLHAGIYYKPETLKAKVCVNGAKRLKQWIIKKNLPLNQCGKLVIPTNKKEDSQLEILYSRGTQNGASVEIVNQEFLNKYASTARSASDRALYSPGTCVTNPKLVMQELVNELSDLGIKFFLGSKNYKIEQNTKQVILTKGNSLKYGYLVNAAGIHALGIAKEFSIGLNYSVMPFKGNYWGLKEPKRFNIKTNLYPVPDLNVPFLGVHFTPSANGDSIYVGPTATPALGFENYKTLENIDLSTTISSLTILSQQYINNTGNIRRYVNEQSLMWSKYVAINQMKKMIPNMEITDLKNSKKVGIRPQLYDKKLGKLEDDLVCISDHSSVHVLNAISPAFTASFELADHIIATSVLSSIN